MNNLPTPDGRLAAKRTRRNGRLQACEPCRKHKLSCGHETPACGRCVRLRRSADCFYHPHPLSRGALPRGSVSASSQLPQQQPLQQSQRSHDGSPIRPDGTTPGLTPDSTCSQPPPPKDSGYVGATFYSNILSSEGVDTSNDDQRVDAETPRHLNVSADRIIRGCQVLGFLKHHELAEKLIFEWYDFDQGMGSLTLQYIFREWFTNLWLHHGDVLTAQDPAQIRRLSELIWHNTQHPIPFNSKTTGREYARLGSGPNLRWEVVGCIAALVGLTAKCLPDRLSDEILRDSPMGSKEDMCWDMMEKAETCLAFCRECGSFADSFLWLLTDYAGMVQILRGLQNYDAYRATGECIDAVIDRGWHQRIRPNDNQTPFFLVEIRKRLLLAVYCLEISVASFLGRPPRLQYRYCILELPLDLDDAELFLGGDELRAVLSKLDSSGYRVAGGPGLLHRSITRARIWFGFTRPREDILDLALAEYSKEEVLERAARIEAAIDAHRASLPPHLAELLGGDVGLITPGPGPAANGKATTANEALELASLRQGYRANVLLLQRVLLRKTGAGAARLVTAAREMLGDVLAVTGRHDVLANHPIDVFMSLVGSGLRSAAILAVELLKQERILQEWQAEQGNNKATTGASPEPPLLLPRSQTIQQLSVFIARLQSMDRSNPSIDMADQGAKVLGRILDKILTPGSLLVQPVAAATTHHAAVSDGNGNNNGNSDGDGGSDGQRMGSDTFAGFGQSHQPLVDVSGVASCRGSEKFGSHPTIDHGFTEHFFGGMDQTLSFDLGEDVNFTEWLGSMNWELGGF